MLFVSRLRAGRCLMLTIAAAMACALALAHTAPAAGAQHRGSPQHHGSRRAHARHGRRHDAKKASAWAVCQRKHQQGKWCRHVEEKHEASKQRESPPAAGEESKTVAAVSGEVESQAPLGASPIGEQSPVQPSPITEAPAKPTEPAPEEEVTRHELAGEESGKEKTAHAEEERRREEAKAREEAEKRAGEEAEKKAKEEAKAREEAEKKARKEEAKAKEEAEKKAKEAAEAKAREEAEKKAREETEKRAREESEKRAREEAEKKAKEEAEQKAREEAQKAEEEKKAKEAQAPFRFFSSTSVWNEEPPADAPLESNSAAVVTAFVNEIAAYEAAKKAPNINTSSWSVPVYTVPAGQPLVKVTLEAARLSKSPALQTAWEAVPLPSNAQPAAGTDKHLVLWQPSTDKLWEFWHLEKTEAGWEAGWGGAMQDALTDSGSYGPEAWSGALTTWGASATSLSIAGGLITLEDLEKGEINHALAMAIPNPRGEVYAAPAHRTDGWSTEATSIPEGAHLRLNPSLNLASLHLPKLTLMMAEAAQRYGIVVRDSAANVAVYGQDPTPTGTNPYTGSHGYYEGKSAQQILQAFPWKELQLLKMELR
ncbi:MAG TPA: hypothetical protein VL979_13810 [Solirubrobacteraceae bacterium]|nr:hypothetical protein [Solirubrobacteraceae bacterium]